MYRINYDVMEDPETLKSIIDSAPKDGTWSVLNQCAFATYYCDDLEEVKKIIAKILDVPLSDAWKAEIDSLAQAENKTATIEAGCGSHFEIRKEG